MSLQAPSWIDYFANQYRFCLDSYALRIMAFTRQEYALGESTTMMFLSLSGNTCELFCR